MCVCSFLSYLLIDIFLTFHIIFVKIKEKILILKLYIGNIYINVYVYLNIIYNTY